MTAEEKREMCRNCDTRKAYAQIFDIHIDWRDCPHPCKANEEKEKENE